MHKLGIGTGLSSMRGSATWGRVQAKWSRLGFPNSHRATTIHQWEEWAFVCAVMLKQLIRDSKTKFEVAPRRGFSLEDGRTSQDGGYLFEVAEHSTNDSIDRRLGNGIFLRSLGPPT